MLVAQQEPKESSGIGEELRPCDPSTVSWKEPSIWTVQSDTLSRARPREAQIAAALLYLNSKLCPTYRLLKGPFPTAGDARFAALYLDDSFLERKDLTTDAALEELTKFGSKDVVPADLLLELTCAMFETLKQQDSIATEHDTYTLLKSLAKSDRPKLASGLINKLISERPGDSSWHRHLLTRGFLGSLPSGEARDYVSHLIKEMQARLAVGPDVHAKAQFDTTKQRAS